MLAFRIYTVQHDPALFNVLISILCVKLKVKIRIRKLFKMFYSEHCSIYSWNEMLVIRLCEVNHQILHCWGNFSWISLCSFDGAFICEFHKTRDCSFRGQNRIILNYGAILYNTSATLKKLKCCIFKAYLTVNFTFQFLLTITTFLPM